MMQKEWRYTTQSEMFDALDRIYPVLNRHTDSEKIEISLVPDYAAFSHDDGRIFISADYQTNATATVSAEQLSRLISAITQTTFIYSPYLMVDAVFTRQSLPLPSDAELLEPFTFDWPDFFEKQQDLSQLELRFIDYQIGFGVYSRSHIPADTPILVYTGLYRNDHEDREYRFNDKDAFNLNVSARHQGNLARFINHASSENSYPALTSANVYSLFHHYHGLGLVVIYAKQDIHPGEQLLMDYGKKQKYWSQLFYFNENNQLCDEQARPVPSSPENALFQKKIDSIHRNRSR